MNAPDKFCKKLLLAPGVYVLRSSPAKARASRRQAASLLLMALRRAPRTRGGKTARTYLKEIRAARNAR